jgi:hypothetical protein
VANGAIEVIDFAGNGGFDGGFLAIWDSGFRGFVRFGGGSFALGDAMAKPRDDRQRDLLRPALEEIIDLGHPLVRLAREIDWGFLDTRFAGVCAPGAGQPPLPTRLVAGLFILKHMHDLSDEVLCARWLENPYYQFFCGELSFCHGLPFDRSSLTHWRQHNWRYLPPPSPYNLQGRTTGFANQIYVQAAEPADGLDGNQPGKAQFGAEPMARPRP